MSSSVAVVLPILESTGMLHSRIGNTIIGITVLEDLASLLLLSLLLQSFQTVATVPLWILYPLLGVLLLVFRWLVPRIRLIVGRHTPVESQLFQQDLRVILSILIGTVLVFELLGLHAIIGAFFAGLVLSDSIRSETLRHKLQSISYGLFVPVFFILLGTQADLSVFTATHVLWITLAITAASITSKFLTGYIGGRLTGLSSQQAGILGIATTPQLSTSLAAAITSVEVGLLSIQYLPVIVGLTLITTLIGPIITRLLISRYQAQPVT